MIQQDTKPSPDVTALIEKITGADGDARFAAWQSAGPQGAGAIAPLADAAASGDRAIARAAKGAMEKITHYAARSGASREAHEVGVELLKVGDSSRPTPVRAGAIHLLGFVGDGRTVPGLAKLLKDSAVQDEARMALEQIPGSASLNALKSAIPHTDAPFQSSLKQSVYNRSLTPKTVGTQTLATR